MGMLDKWHQEVQPLWEGIQTVSQLCGMANKYHLLPFEA